MNSIILNNQFMQPMEGIPTRNIIIVPSQLVRN